MIVPAFFERHTTVFKGVFADPQFRSDRKLFPEFFEKLPLKRLYSRLVPIDLASGKRPEVVPLARCKSTLPSDTTTAATRMRWVTKVWER